MTIGNKSYSSANVSGQDFIAIQEGDPIVIRDSSSSTFNLDVVYIVDKDHAGGSTMVSFKDETGAKKKKSRTNVLRLQPID